MGKERVRFICRECGYEAPKWFGRCPGCGQWNTLEEEQVGSKPDYLMIESGARPPLSLAGIPSDDLNRLSTGFCEVDRVLGGGLVPGVVILLGGDPGVGKSTLLLQIAQVIARERQTVLYVSGEESPTQVKGRLMRLGRPEPSLLFLNEMNIKIVDQYIQTLRPGLVIIDSIQTMFHPEIQSLPGSISQVRESAGYFLRRAKEQDVPIVLVGHVNKEGSIAGPNVLQHVVDVVLYLEGEKYQDLRIIRAVKNRFGSASEVGLLRLTEKGLEDVGSPSEAFLAERPQGASGSVVICGVEGSRPILAELQALVTTTAFGMPRRMAAGVDYNRVALIVAVLEKRLGLNLANQDIYVKISGGMRSEEPSTDLGIAVAITSGFRDIPTDPRLVVVGEVGLAGEVRSVSGLEGRVKEAERLGFERIIVPRSTIQSKQGQDWGKIRVIGVANVMEAVEIALER